MNILEVWYLYDPRIFQGCQYILLHEYVTAVIGLNSVDPKITIGRQR
jgi:hypothetical protein